MKIQASLFGLVVLGACGVASGQGIAPDRMVAEWVLRMGGSVIPEGQRAAIGDITQLPPGDFHIHTLNLSGVTIADANIQGLTIVGYDVGALIAAERARGNS